MSALDQRIADLPPEKRDLLSLLLKKKKASSARQHRISTRADTRERPLSFAQQRLWFLDQLDPQSSLYNVSGMLHLQGPLDVQVLQASLQKILLRHETLRAIFVAVSGQPMQFVQDAPELPLTVVDLQHLPANTQATEVKQLAQVEAQRPFDLSKDLLLRATLLCLQPEKHLLLLTVHHIAFDGWSTNIFVQELVALYSAELDGRSPALDLPFIQYADYAQWQRDQLANDAFKPQLDFWQRQLEGQAGVLELPTDNPRPLVQAHRGAQHHFALGPTLCRQLKQFAQAENVTLFILLLTVYKVLLHRYTQQPDISIGTPIANRTRSEIEDLIGFFVNTLVLRSDLSGQPTFRQLLQQVRQTSLEAYAHQDVPFEMLVEMLQPERTMSHMPLFQVMFELQEAPVSRLQMADITVELAANYGGAAKFDLLLSIIDRGDQLTAVLEYDAALFSVETIQRLAGHFQVLLAAAAADPEQSINRLPLLSAVEQRQLLVEWNATAVPAPHHLTIHQLFAEQAVKTPHETAVVAENGRLSFGELNERANQVAHTLQALGVQTGSIVGLCIERSVEMIVGLLGILKAGGAYLPLDPDYPAERLAFMLTDARPKAVLTQTALAASPWLQSGGQPAILCLDTNWAEIERRPQTNPFTKTTGEDLAYLIYTSGSTGQPKGAMVPHRGALNLRAGLEAEIYKSLPPGPLRLSLNAPLAFDASVQQFVMLTSGHTLYVIPQDIRGDGDALLDYIRHHRLHVLDCVPSQLKVLLAAGLLDGQEWRPTAVLPGGEAIDPATWQQLAQATETDFYNMYGPTECSVDSTIGHVRRYPAQPTIGRPIANAQLYVLDKHFQPVPVGVPGELFIGGAGVGLGYLNRPELTAKNFILLSGISNQWGVVSNHLADDRLPHTVYRTGDLVRYRPEGTLEFLGRSDHQVKIRGFRLELGEIEAQLRRHEALNEVIVVALAPEANPADRHLVAFFVAEEDTAVSPETLRQYLKPKLPEYMIPTFFVPLDKMPLTPNRKIDRRGLPTFEQIQACLTTDHTPPRTPQEEILANLWTGLLGVETIGIHDNFFALGGHSLLATQLVSRIRSTFQVDLPLRTLFENPTIAGLATQLGDTEPNNLPPLIPQPEDGRSQLSFAQQRLWFLEHMEAGGGLYNISDAVRLTGALDVTAFSTALNDVLARHETLRSAFTTDPNGKPALRVVSDLTIAVPFEDIRTLEEAEQWTRIQQTAVAEANTPFNLNDPPLLRLRLLQTAAAEHIALITMHHIISDGWSVGVLIRELAATYAQHTGQPGQKLPALPIQYKDFVRWQHSLLESGALQDELDYWKNRLANSPPLLKLPTDWPRPPQPTFVGGKRPFSLPEDLTNQLKVMARQENVTLFMVLLAGFQTLLHRFSGAEVINVGSPIANRTQKETENLVGFFINTLVLQGNFSGEQTFRQLLQQTRQTTLDAYAHQVVPFEMVVDAVQPARNLSHSPLFQVMFVLQNAPFDPDPLPGITLEPLEIDNGTAKFDLTLFMLEEDDRLSGAWEYNTDLFDQATIERFVSHFQVLLSAIVANPDESVARLPLLTAAERQQILVAWNDTAVPLGHSLCFHQLFEAQAASTPAAAAVIFQDQQLSYAQLNARANRLAHHLRRLGVGPETLVAICVERSLEMLVGLLGILKAGGAYVPLDPTYPPERLAFMVDDARPAVVLTQAHLRQRHPFLDEPAQAGMPVLCLDTDWPAIAQASSENPANLSSLANLAYVIYTSGSTGQPKGTMLLHRGLVNYLTWCQQAYPLAQGRGVPVHSSISFDLTITALFAPLLAGKYVHLLPEGLSVEVLSQALTRFEDFSLVKITPAHLALLGHLLDPASVDGCTHGFIIGGENLLAKNLAFWQQWAPQTVLINEYGPTETVVGCCVYRVPAGASLPGSVPIGRPIINTQLYILDRLQQPVPVGVPGELYIGGAGVGRGYLNRPELTAERFIENLFDEGTEGQDDRVDDYPVALSSASASGTLQRLPNAVTRSRLYRTGDLCRWLPDGNIEFLGRLDHQVKIHGFRIELGEIEAVLRQHDAVKQTAVIDREDASGHKRLFAYLVATDGALEDHMLRDYLAARLPEYMLPSAFVWLEHIPLTVNGKVDRLALPAPEGLRPALAMAFEPPRSPQEKILADVWRQLLGVPDIGIHDSFFELGGDSILAIQVIARARQAGLHLTARQLFRYPTVAQLALAAESVPEAAAEQGEVTGDVPLTPIQRWFFEHSFAEAHHWNQTLLLALPEPVPIDLLQTAVSHLVRHHDALRLRFRRTATGWSQTHDGQAQEEAVAFLDLSHLPPSAQQERFLSEANKFQASLDLAAGPLLRGLYCHFGSDQQAKLLITVHHLVIDGISWRILLEDLQLLIQQLAVEQAVRLPAKTTSFKQWANLLTEYAGSDELAGELAYWAALAEVERPLPFPVDFPPTADANLVQHARTIGVALSVEETEALLRDVPPVYGTEINDILLTALALAYRRISGAHNLWLALEGHGREELFPGADLSRTVGWFTSIFPVNLDLRFADSAADAIKQVKEQIRRMPNRGLGYGVLRYLHPSPEVQQQMANLPAPQISFNYLGQFGQTADEFQFEPGQESSGTAVSPQSHRPHILALNGGISGGKLQIEWTFSHKIHRPGTIEKMADHFIEALQQLIAHCQNPEAGGYTPSDFPDVALSSDDLDALLLEIND